MKSEWKKIWNKKETDLSLISGEINEENLEDIFLELKRLAGFDVIGDGMNFQALYQQYLDTKKMLIEESEKKRECQITSLYEVGCGSGANLLLFERDRYRVGGIDYSKTLLEAAEQVLETKDLDCGEALQMETEKKYDVILSNSVFSYFEDEKYARKVLEKMWEKANFAIGLIDIHDIEKKEAFISYRKQKIEDYENRYKNLSKYFYDKKFFMDFAEEKGMEIVFTSSRVDGYWNNDFVFNCFMYKRAVNA